MNTETKQKQKKSQKGTLAIVGLLLLLSSGFRLATEAGQVFAQGTENVASTLTKAEEFATDRLELAQPKYLTKALKAIQDREVRLAEKEQEMEERLKTVEAAEEAVREEFRKLEHAERSLQETITLASKAAENDVAQLTRVYSNMKPKQAAALFEKMEASFAAGFLFRMPPDTAARVMAGMTPEKAYLVSVELAGRNADIPLE